MNTPELKIPAIKVDWAQLKLAPFDLRIHSNGVKVYQIQTSKPGLCSFEIIFRNGRISEHKKLVSRMAANQIQEGTAEISPKGVADLIDYYGANLTIHADLDFTVVSMSCLQKHFQTICRLIADLLLKPAYPEKYLEKAKQLFKSQLQHQLAEPDYVSYREFTALVYGSESIYGYNTSIERIDALTTDDLRRYQQENYVSDRMEVFYCGDVSSDTDKFLDEILAPFGTSPVIHNFTYSGIDPIAQKIHFPIEQSSQVSLKLGVRGIPKTHPDYFGYYLLNVVLGDYFGSRLMKNLREDKGYTYDIHSTLDSQVYDGCFYISAELNTTHIDRAIQLIKDEINRLRTDRIPVDELNLVRNYICGNIMRLMDGPFQTMLFIKILSSEYGGTEAFPHLLNAVLNTDSEQLRDIAIKYLEPEKLILVTAGA